MCLKRCFSILQDCDREREEREGGGESYKFALYKEPESIEVVVDQGGALQNKCMITSHQLCHNDVHTGSRQYKSNNIMSYFILESTRQNAAQLFQSALHLILYKNYMIELWYRVFNSV